MRNKIIFLLKNAESSKQKKLYTDLVKAFAQETDARTVYYYQLGYTPEKLTGIIYDVKKHFKISDKEVALYNGDGNEDDEEVEKAEEIKAPEVPIIPINPNDEILKSLNLDENPEVKDAITLRDQYPFLSEENCPDIFKILVADKITAYKKYAAAHAEILEAENEADAEEKLYEIGKTALANWSLNQEIKEELDFYRDTNGKILGNHPLLADMKMKQDVGEMSEADLVKARTNAQKSVSRYEKDETKKELSEKWQKKLSEIERRLTQDFKHTLK